MTTNLFWTRQNATTLATFFIVDTPDSERPPRGNLSYPKFDRFDEIYPMETTRRD